MIERMDFGTLLRNSLFAPSEAARRLLGLGLTRPWLWTALVLMAVLNAIVYSVVLRVAPPTQPGGISVIPPAFEAPLLLTVFMLAGLVITVHALTRVGQLLGGTGRTEDILVLIVWMQALRLLFQLAVTLVGLISPYIGALLVLAGTIWGIGILTAFVNTAHRFGNRLKAFGVLVLAALAMIVGLTVILGVLGAAIVGVS